jgi:hypothetical protein
VGHGVTEGSPTPPRKQRPADQQGADTRTQLGALPDHGGESHERDDEPQDPTRRTQTPEFISPTRALCEKL